jgi:OOP family OmpA-OmpF porin
MKQALIVVGFASALTLGGCAGVTFEGHVEELQAATPQGSDFAQAITAEYAGFAAFEAYEMVDKKDADYFARKGLLTATGVELEPEVVDHWMIPADHVAELQQARLRLMASLEQGRGAFPVRAAVAQARYDCWMEQQEEDVQPDDIAACRQEFYAALEDLEVALNPPVSAPAPAPAAPIPAVFEPAEFQVLFPFDSAELTSEAVAILLDAVASYREQQPMYIAVDGHTDTAGASEYNQLLSKARANAVAQSLIGLGIPAEITSVTAYGEDRPQVITDDDVRAQPNRRSVVIFR